MVTALPLLLVAAFLQDDKPLDKGPIHEAYAQAFEAKPVIGPFLKKKPPEPLEEVSPEDKPQGNDVRWIAGYWHWDDERDDFIWISGFWRQIPPGKEWVPGRFESVNGQWRWVPGYWREMALDQEEFLEEAPPPIPEVGPSIPAPGPQMVWASGYWVRQGFRWGWRPGVWINQRPGWVWTPARWVFTPFGFTFLPGYWDYALEYRGLLYAPVYYQPALVLRPGFCHRPRYIVCYQDLPCGLFTRRGFVNYFYGDYFRPGYVNVGFQFWANTTVRPDPLFTYYRAINNDRWAREFEFYRRERMAGRAAVVPVIGTTVVQNTTNVTNVTNINNNQKQTVINNRNGTVAVGPGATATNAMVTKTGQVRVVEAKQQPPLVLASNHPTPTTKDIPESQIAPKGQGKARPIPNREKDARTGLAGPGKEKEMQKNPANPLLSEKDRDRLKDAAARFRDGQKKEGVAEKPGSLPSRTGEGKLDSGTLANPKLTGKGPNPNPAAGSTDAGKSTGTAKAGPARAPTTNGQKGPETAPKRNEGVPPQTVPAANPNLPKQGSGGSPPGPNGQKMSGPGSTPGVSAPNSILPTGVTPPNRPNGSQPTPPTNGGAAMNPARVNPGNTVILPSGTPVGSVGAPRSNPNSNGAAMNPARLNPGNPVQPAPGTPLGSVGAPRSNPNSNGAPLNPARLNPGNPVQPAPGTPLGSVGAPRSIPNNPLTPLRNPRTNPATKTDPSKGKTGDAKGPVDPKKPG